MSQPPEEARSRKREQEGDATRKARAKKTYHPPSLVEYGSIAKLTQSGGTIGGDGRGMMACL